jgi:hypothetical protein
MKSIIKRFWEKFDKGFIPETQLVHIIGPVNKQPAPDHHSEHREIDPMEPSNS